MVAPARKPGAALIAKDVSPNRAEPKPKKGQSVRSAKRTDRSYHRMQLIGGPHSGPYGPRAAHSQSDAQEFLDDLFKISQRRDEAYQSSSPRR